MITKADRQHIISKAADMMMEYGHPARSRLKAYCDGYFSTRDDITDDEKDRLCALAVLYVQAVMEELKNEQRNKEELLSSDQGS